MDFPHPQKYSGWNLNLRSKWKHKELRLLTFPWSCRCRSESFFQDIPELRGILDQESQQAQSGSDVVIFLSTKPYDVLTLTSVSSAPSSSSCTAVVQVQFSLGIVAAGVKLGYRAVSTIKGILFRWSEYVKSIQKNINGWEKVQCYKSTGIFHMISRYHKK